MKLFVCAFALFIAHGAPALGQSRSASGLGISSPRLQGFRWTKPLAGQKFADWSGVRRSDGAQLTLSATYCKSRRQMLKVSNPNAGSMIRHDPTFHARSVYTHRKIGDGYWAYVQPGSLDIYVRNGLDVYHGSMDKIKRRRPDEAAPRRFPITTEGVATVEDLILAAIKERAAARP